MTRHRHSTHHTTHKQQQQTNTTHTHPHAPTHPDTTDKCSWPLLDLSDQTSSPSKKSAGEGGENGGRGGKGGNRGGQGTAQNKGTRGGGACTLQLCYCSRYWNVQVASCPFHSYEFAHPGCGELASNREDRASLQFEERREEGRKRRRRRKRREREREKDGRNSSPHLISKKGPPIFNCRTFVHTNSLRPVRRGTPTSTELACSSASLV